MAPPKPPPRGSVRARLLNVATKLNVVVYRLSKGRIGGKMQDAPVCVLHHVGRKSGKKRETPLLYLADGDDVVLVASHAGADASPAWYHNLMAMDSAEVEIKGERKQLKPHRADAEEKARLWPKLNAIYSDYDVYQTRTTRDIPVVVMTPTT